MLVFFSFVFLPALALSKSVSDVGATAQDLQFCEYLDARIRDLANSKKLIEGVDSDVKPSSKICDIVSKLAAECAANRQGDECAAGKMDNLMKLRDARKNSPSGRLIFYHCEQMNYEKVMKLFTTMRAMMSAECGLPAQQGTRNRRNTDLLLPLLLGGAYDSTSIWYQYFLCKTQDIYCYFFTQGWTQADYGQYYLYDTLLDDQDGLFKGADSNLATLALLGGLGGGHGGYGQPAPYYGGYAEPAPSAAPSSRRRRDTTAAKPGCSEVCVSCTEGTRGCVNRQKCNVVCRDGKGFDWISSWISSFFGGDEDEEDEDEEDEDEEDEEEEDEEEEDEDEEDEDEEDEDEEDEEDEDDEDEDDEDEDEDDEDDEEEDEDEDE